MRKGMRLQIYRFRFHLISLFIHAFIFVLLTGISFKEILPTPAFQTTVYFESQPVTKKITKSRSTSTPAIKRKSKTTSVSKIRNPKKTAISKVSTVEETEKLPPVRLKPNSVIPFLKSGKKESQIQTSDQMETLFKKKEYRIPYLKKEPTDQDRKDTQETVTKVARQPESDETAIEDLSSIAKKNVKSSVTGITNSTNVWQKKNDLVIYRNILGKLITANWIVPPVSIKKFQILFEVYIDPKGNLIEINLITGSGLAILDAAAERSIRVSTPFPEYPKSFDAELKSFKAVFRFTPERVGI